MKISVSLLLDTPPIPVPGRAPVRGPTVDERIEYASECIECGNPREKKEALLFLKDLFHILKAKESPKKGDLKRLDYIKSILLEYGLAGDIPTKGA